MRIQSFLFLFVTAIATPIFAAEKIDYVQDVLPILETYCVGCHTQDDPEGEFVMDSHAAMMQGGESGLAITAGASQSSRMLMMVTGAIQPKMPPQGEDAPDQDEIEILANWIDQGAIGPSGEMPRKRPLITPKIETDTKIAAPVTAVATSDDGRLRAIARYAGVSVQDADGNLITQIDTDDGKINSLTFSADGSRLLMGSGVTGSYGRAAIFDTQSGTLQTEFVGHRDVLYAAQFSPDESLVATAGYDRKIVLWDTRNGEAIRELTGHNGAIFDLAFSPDGKVIVSGCADETVKVWNVATGQRLATLGQPEGEVFAVAVTQDGKFVIAGSADNRLRVWRLRSLDKPRNNPIVATRFVDESPVVAFDLSPNGKSLVIVSQDGNVKVIRTSDWTQAAQLDRVPDSASDISVDASSQFVWVSLMNGDVVRRQIPSMDIAEQKPQRLIEPIYMDLGDPATVNEVDLRKKISSNQMLSGDSLPIGRGVTILGDISRAGEADRFSWQASAGEVWAIDADRGDKSMIDPIVTILDGSGEPVLRVRLQAVRDSYFTFRGKNSDQVGDFRVFNWQEMNLKQYFYSGGEVTRLWMHPRGPDSGFNVYPGEGKRWTYFGTTNTTHALGEPAYVVRPLPPGQEPLANGLPAFDVYYQNDDDPMRLAGTNSRVLFTAPHDGVFTAKITDTRGDGGDTYAYKLNIRAAKPSYKASVVPIKGDLRRGTGREFTVRIDRFDGFDGPVSFDIDDLPPQIRANTPLVIEAGQRYATGVIWVAEDAEAWDGEINPTVTASTTILGKKVERSVGELGVLKLTGRPSVIPTIKPIDRETQVNEDWTLQVRRGETVSARLVIDRKEDFDKEVSFGKELAGRNTSAGIYIDNIGLNGLIVLKESNERVFFLSADISADPGKRSFFLTANVDGNVTSHPITVEVLP